MPRSGAEARDRLERAALELYSERGYDRTTTAEIATRAGVTERTFFRHFADKREVLFNVESSMQNALAQAFAGVPDTVPPLATVLQAFRAMVPALENDRPVAEGRHRVIAATPALRERELAKAAALSVVVAEALRARGLSDWHATLLAQVGIAALGHVIHTWLAGPPGDIDALIVRAFSDLGGFSDGAVSDMVAARDDGLGGCSGPIRADHREEDRRGDEDDAHPDQGQHLAEVVQRQSDLRGA